jgi:hypothetical protein
MYHHAVSMGMPAFHLQVFAAGCDLACEAGDNEAETDEQTAGEDNIWKYAVRVILAVFSERSR